MSWSQLEPSLVRKIGSRPRVRKKRSWISAAETVHPSAGTWHVEQDRPLRPIDWKNVPVRLIGPPWMLYVSSNPLASGSGDKLGNPCEFAESTKDPSISAANALSLTRTSVNVQFVKRPRRFTFFRGSIRDYRPGCSVRQRIFSS